MTAAMLRRPLPLHPLTTASGGCPETRFDGVNTMCRDLSGSHGELYMGNQRKIWSICCAIVLFCLVPAPLAAALASAGPVDVRTPTLRVQGHPDEVEYFEHPLSREAHLWRERNNVFEGKVNVAVTFVPITPEERADLHARGLPRSNDKVEYKIWDLTDLRIDKPLLYEELKPKLPPGTTILLEVIAANVPVADVKSTHAEELLRRVLRLLGIHESRAVRTYSDRQTCAQRCEVIFRKGTVAHAVA